LATGRVRSPNLERPTSDAARGGLRMSVLVPASVTRRSCQDGAADQGHCTGKQVTAGR
jgi:hypothetical protein